MLVEKLLANVENGECVYGRPSPSYTRMRRMCALIFVPLGHRVSLIWLLWLSEGLSSPSRA